MAYQIFAIAEASTTFFGLTMGLGRGFHDKNVHYIALQKVRSTVLQTLHYVLMSKRFDMLAIFYIY